MKTKTRFPHYWICVPCAKERGGTLGDGAFGATLAATTCLYCDGKKQDERFILPWVDYDWADLDPSYKAFRG